MSHTFHGRHPIKGCPTVVRGILLMLVIGAAAPVSDAQVFTTPKGEAENVRFEQVGAGTVHIFYDLVSSDPRAVFLVTLDASQDRGATFTVRPMSVSGDVGQGVTPGIGKRIVWESGRDVERLEIDQFRFRISAQAGPLELQKVDPPAAPVPAAKPAPPLTTPAAPAAPPQTAAAKPKGGGGTKWLLIGGGAAAAGVAAAAGGSGGGSTPRANTPTGNNPTTTNRPPVIIGKGENAPVVALVLVTVITFEVNATDADGDAMTALWTFGDGTTASAPLSNGRAVTEKSYGTAGVHRPTVTVSDGRGGSVTSPPYLDITANTVTGLYIGGATPAGFTVRLNLVQNGVAVTGDYVDGQGRSATVSSTLRAPRTMEVTLNYRGGGSDIYVVTFAADLKAISAAGRSGNTLTLARQQ